jgi:phosphoribosylanthranilate isomerase
MLGIKICGIARPVDARAAVAAGASAIGMVLAPGTKRTIDIKQARAVVSEVPAGVWRVGVFVSPTQEAVSEAVAALQLTHVQLHGSVDLTGIRSAAGRASLIEAIRMDGPEALIRAAESPADLVLLDAAVAGQHGGTGVSFDWGLLEASPLERAFILAGGLNPDNVGVAVARARPRIVDVSSGVETAPGVKDHQLIARFITEARNAA